MRIKNVQDKHGDRYSLEIYQGKDEIKKEYQQIERGITPVVKKIGIDAKDYIHHWIGNADSIILASQNGKTLERRFIVWHSFALKRIYQISNKCL